MDPLLDAAEQLPRQRDRAGRRRCHAPADFLMRQPISGRFSLTVARRERLGSSEIPDDIARAQRRFGQTPAATNPTATK
ncbi:hypothetical protein [Nocardia fluminea]|uniref:hypothetical protein n=1 Tax=Nocardia fluminea TaxID=134984 RepID=UPI0033E6D308